MEAERTAWFAGNDDVYPYAEQVGRWFGTELGAADELRRHATDLVFAGDDKSLPEAESGIKEASKRYEGIRGDAATLGAAYRLRDQIFCRLPYYARWAAGRRIRANDANPTLELIEQTAAKTHELAEVLENPDPAQLARVKQLVQDLVGTRDPDRPRLFRELELEFQNHLATLKNQAVWSNWHAIDSTS